MKSYVYYSNSSYIKQKVEIIFEPHPLYPPLLSRRGGRVLKKRGFAPLKLLFIILGYKNNPIIK